VEWEVIRRRKDSTRHAHISKRILLSDDEDAAYLIFRTSAQAGPETLLAGEAAAEVIAAGGR
jgi:hypothetical protein